MMMNSQMTKRQIDAIAIVVAALRPDNDGHGWDARGIMAALVQVQDRDPFAVALAAIRAAGNPSNRTPAVIAMDGPHWGNSPAAAPKPATWQAADDNRRCATCVSFHMPGEPCRRHDPEVAARGAAAAREAHRRALAETGVATTPRPTTYRQEAM